MTRLNVAAAALNQTPLDWRGNRDRILRAVEMARNAGASLLCLPELCISGYGCEDAFHSPDVQRTAREMLAEIVPATDGIVVSVGLPLMHQGAVFNSTALCVDGRLAGAVAKQNLAGDGVHYEPRWFKPWPEGHRTTIDLAGRRVPFGDVFFDCGGVRIGFEICEDAWVANRPGGRLARQGVDVIFNPSASHFAFGKQEIRKRFVTEGSRAFGVSYLYANLLGNESGRIIFDGGTLVASDGELQAAGPRFSYADVEVLYSQIDVDQTRMNRSQLASFEPDLEDAEQACVPCDFDYRPATPDHQGPRRPARTPRTDPAAEA
jgi:NAD+ synthase (glutamine-hydrolysing)